MPIKSHIHSDTEIANQCAALTLARPDYAAAYHLLLVAFGIESPGPEPSTGTDLAVWED